jgi:hypothetical protein
MCGLVAPGAVVAAFALAGCAVAKYNCTVPTDTFRFEAIWFTVNPWFASSCTCCSSCNVDCTAARAAEPAPLFAAGAFATGKFTAGAFAAGVFTAVVLAAAAFPAAVFAVGASAAGATAAVTRAVAAGIAGGVFPAGALAAGTCAAAAVARFDLAWSEIVTWSCGTLFCGGLAGGALFALTVGPVAGAWAGVLAVTAVVLRSCAIAELIKYPQLLLQSDNRQFRQFL